MATAKSKSPSGAPNPTQPKADTPEKALPERAGVLDVVALFHGQIAADEVLAWRDYGDWVVVVTVDGRKLSSADVEASGEV